MSTRVDGGLFESISRKVFELSRQVIQPGGYPYNPEQLERQLQLLIEGKFASWMPDIFVSPEVQLMIFRQRNWSWQWGFGPKDIEKLGPPPVWPDKPLSAVVLDVSLGNYIDTANWAYQSIKSVFDNVHNFGVSFSPQLFRLARKAQQKRGLRWSVIDLGGSRWVEGENWKGGCTFESFIETDPELPSATILWAASYFPKWVNAMNKTNSRPYLSHGRLVPPVIISGYRTRHPKDDDWPNVPMLSSGPDVNSVNLAPCLLSVPLGKIGIPEFIK